MEISNLKTQRINQNDYHKNIFTRNKIGALYTFPKRFTPEYCLACDGYVLKIIDFSELYEIIGTTFNSGTEADDEFRIPDYNLTGIFLQPGNKNLGTAKNAGIPLARGGSLPHAADPHTGGQPDRPHDCPRPAPE